MKSSLTKISLAISVTIASLLSLPSAANASNCDALYYGSSNNADLSYCNLSGMDFSVGRGKYIYNHYSNFYGANLEYTNLSGRSFYQSTFDSTNSNGAKFRNTQLQNLSFSSSTASEADFSESWLYNSSFANTNLSNATLSKSTVHWSNFYGANLANADLTGASFLNTSFENADLTGADLTGATFTNCNLNNVIIEGARLDKAQFKKTTLSNVSGTPLESRNRYPNINGVLILPGVNLAGLDLSGTDLSNVDLTRTNLQGANLNGVNFQRAILRGTDFRGASMLASDFTGADLSYARLQGSNASSANFTYARFIQASLQESNLNGASLNHAVIGKANFSGASLDSADLSGAVLLSGIRGFYISGEPMMPSGWMLRRGYMLGPYVSIDGADLSELNLDGVNLTGANLRQVNFKNTSLADAKFGRSYLDGSNFTNAYLGNSVFFGASINGVNFSNAYLVGVKSGGLIFQVKPRTTSGWNVLNNYLVGPGAVLSGANFNSLDLSGFDLSDAVLYGVNLAGANLNNANLSRVKLSGAILAGATLEGVTSSGIVGQPTVMPDGWVVDGGAVVRALTNTPKPDIQGVYKTNQLLSVRTGSWDSGVEFTYSWLRDGAEISEANASSYRLTSSDTGHQISVRVSGSKAGYQRVSVESRSFFVAEESLAASISGNPRVGAVLTAGPSNLGQATVTYQWFSNGRTVKGATSNTYFPQIQDLGKKISVVATIIGQGSGKIVSTSPHVTISEGILEAPDISMSGIPVMGGSLSANVPAISGVKVTSKWYRDGIAMPVGSSSYTLKSSDVGHRFKVVSTFSKKGFVSAVSHSQEYLVAPAIAVATANPSISGVMQPGKVLKAKSGTWMSNTKFEYQWLRDGVPIEEANFSSYQLLSSDRGKQISVRVTGSKAGYTKLTLLSNSVMFN